MLACCFHLRNERHEHYCKMPIISETRWLIKLVSMTDIEYMCVVKWQRVESWISFASRPSPDFFLLSIITKPHTQKAEAHFFNAQLLDRSSWKIEIEKQMWLGNAIIWIWRNFTVFLYRLSRGRSPCSYLFIVQFVSLVWFSVAQLSHMPKKIFSTFRGSSAYLRVSFNVLFFSLCLAAMHRPTHWTRMLAVDG